MLNMLKFNGSSDIDFLSVIHAKIINVAKQMGLLMMKFFHIIPFFLSSPFSVSLGFEFKLWELAIDSIFMVLEGLKDSLVTITQCGSALELNT